MFKATKLLIASLGSIVFMVISALSYATPISYIYSGPVDLNEKINHGNGYTISADLSSGISYDPAADTLGELGLILHFGGVGNSWNNREFQISLGGGAVILTRATASEVSLKIDLSTYDIQELLTPEGLMHIVLRANDGNPYLMGYTLNISGERLIQPELEAHDIPTPSTLALMGLGLVGSVFLRRRKS